MSGDDDTLRDWLTGDHATPAAYRMGFVTAEQVLALLDRLEAAERDRDRLIEAQHHV